MPLNYFFKIDWVELELELLPLCGFVRLSFPCKRLGKSLDCLLRLDGKSFHRAQWKARIKLIGKKRTRARFPGQPEEGPSMKMHFSPRSSLQILELVFLPQHCPHWSWETFPVKALTHQRLEHRPNYSCLLFGPSFKLAKFFSNSWVESFCLKET